MKRFLTNAVALTAIFGVYLAAREVDLELAFFLIVVLAAVAAYGGPLLTMVGYVFDALRYYRRTLERVSDLETAHVAASGRIETLERELHAAREAGVDEGKLQVLGSLLSHRLTKLPTLEGVTVDQGGLLLIANCDEDAVPVVSTRFLLEDKLTGSRKGIVEVQDVTDSSSVVRLRPHTLSDPAFWRELQSRAAVDSTTPPNLRLDRYVFDPPERDLQVVSPIEQEQPDGEEIAQDD